NNNKTLVQDQLAFQKYVQQLRQEMIQLSLSSCRGAGEQGKSQVLQECISNKEVNEIVKCMGTLERMRHKTGALRLHLDLQAVSFESEDLLTAFQMCPLTVVHEYYIDLIQKSMLTSMVASFDRAMGHWTGLCAVETVYDKIFDQLLLFTQGDSARSPLLVKTWVPDLLSCNEALVNYVRTYFGDIALTGGGVSEQRADKWTLFRTLADVYYHMRTYEVHLHRLDACLHKITSAHTHSKEERKEDRLEDELQQEEEEEKEKEHKGKRKTTPAGRRRLLVEIIDKMNEMFSTIIALITSSLHANNNCMPVRYAYFGPHSDLNQVLLNNCTTIDVNILTTMRSTASKVVEKTIQVVETIETIDLSLHKDERIASINAILDSQSEIAADGIISLLEKLYHQTKSVQMISETWNANNTVENPHFEKKWIGGVPVIQSILKPKEKEKEKEKEAAKTNKDKEKDKDKDKDSKKPSGIIPPWTIKTSNLRSEMEAAEGYREQLENAMAEIKEKKKEVFMVRQEQQRVRDEIHIVKLQLQRSEQTVEEMTTYELKCKTLISELDKMKAKNEQLTKNIELKEAQIDTLSNNCNGLNSSTTLKSMRNRNNNNHIMRTWIVL
ncbi:hypothetical protein RFI_08353, partial [Reticulomyxa filosa]